MDTIKFQNATNNNINNNDSNDDNNDNKEETKEENDNNSPNTNQPKILNFVQTVFQYKLGKLNNRILWRQGALEGTGTNSFYFKTKKGTLQKIGIDPFPFIYLPWFNSYIDKNDELYELNINCYGEPYSIAIDIFNSIFTLNAFLLEFNSNFTGTNVRIQDNYGPLLVNLLFFFCFFSFSFFLIFIYIVLHI